MLLQMEGFDSAVDQLSESTIKLAEAAANFGALKVIFGVFLVFMLIIMVAFFWQLFSTQRRVQDIHHTTKKVEKYIEEASSRTVGKEQASILIRRAFNSLSQTVKYYILRTRIENHIDQEEATASKIERIAKYEYSELSSYLANFGYGDVSLSEHVKIEDFKLISDFMMEQIYISPEVFTISGMDQATDILLNGLKLEALKNIK